MMNLNPSYAFRWVHCSAFPRFAEQAPPLPATTAALEGIAASALIKRMLDGKTTKAADDIGKHNHVDAAMAHHVQTFVDKVLSLGDEITCEELLTFHLDPHIAGRSDVIVLNRTKNILYVIDFKYGHRVVEVENNEQLIIYGTSKLQKLNEYCMKNGYPLVQLAIYQPRALHRHGIYRKQVLNHIDLFTKADHIIERAEATLDPDSVATPGPWCHNCSLAARCEALAQTVVNVVDTVTSNHVAQLSAEELARELEYRDAFKDIVEARWKAIETEGLERQKHEVIPGWTSETGKGHRKFTVDGAMLQMLTGVDPWEDRKLCTPAEYVRRGVSEEILDTVTEQPTTKRKLVRQSADDIAKIFNTGENQNASI